MENTIKYAVLGGGSWATAIVKMLSENLSTIYWYMHNERAIEHIQTYKHNPNYLSSVELHTEKLHLTSDINQAVAQADYLIFVIPRLSLLTNSRSFPFLFQIKLFSQLLRELCHKQGKLLVIF